MQKQILIVTFLGLSLLASHVSAETLTRTIHCEGIGAGSDESNTSQLFKTEVYTDAMADGAAKNGYSWPYGGATCYQMDGKNNTGIRYDLVLLKKWPAPLIRDLDPLQYFTAPLTLRVSGDRAALDSADGLTLAGSPTGLANNTNTVQGAVANARVGADDNVLIIVRPRMQTRMNVAEGIRRMGLSQEERKLEDAQMTKAFYQRADDNYPEFERMLIWENLHSSR